MAHSSPRRLGCAGGRIRPGDVRGQFDRLAVSSAPVAVARQRRGIAGIVERRAIHGVCRGGLLTQPLEQKQLLLLLCCCCCCCLAWRSSSSCCLAAPRIWRAAGDSAVTLSICACLKNRAATAATAQYEPRDALHLGSHYNDAEGGRGSAVVQRRDDVRRSCSCFFAAQINLRRRRGYTKCSIAANSLRVRRRSRTACGRARSASAS